MIVAVGFGALVGFGIMAVVFVVLAALSSIVDV
jgi:hypothetical protein